MAPPGSSANNRPMTARAASVAKTLAIAPLPSYLSQVSLRHARLVPPALDSAGNSAALRSQLEPRRCLQQHCRQKSLRERARSPGLTEPQQEGSRYCPRWRQAPPIGQRRPRCSHSPSLGALPCSSPAIPERAGDRGEPVRPEQLHHIGRGFSICASALILRWMNCAIG